MCQILPARVVRVDGERVEVELHGGTRASASSVLVGDLAAGDHVMIDRGLVVKRIAAEEAAAILAIYEEMSVLLAASPE